MMITDESVSPYLLKPVQSEAEFKAARRACALEKARAAVDRCMSDLRGYLLDADTDKEAVGAIQSALDGLHDYGMEIHHLITERERDVRIERLEIEAEREYERSVRSLTGQV